MSELDELKTLWLDQNRKLDQSLRLNRRLLNSIGASGAQSALNRLAIALAVHAAAWLVVAGVLGNFIYEHLSEVRFAAAAIALDGLAILSMILLTREIVAILRVDHSRPVASLQKELEAIRVRRIRYIQVAVLAGTLLWTPLVIVFLKAVWGVDAYSIPGPAWLVSNLLFSIAVIALALWIAKRYRDQLANATWMQGFMRDLAGYNLRAAEEFLTNLAEFEKE